MTIRSKSWTPEEIRDLRKRFSLSRKKLGDMLGVTVPTIYRWENDYNEPYKPLRILLTKIEQELTDAAKGGKKS
jgi:DNA-binding transcriptional regulator YiaG